jgi:hypothetical protein
MEIFGDLQHRSFRHPDLAANAPVAGRARLQVGDANHVVVAHSVGQVLGRRDRERTAPPGAFKAHRPIQPVQIFRAIGEVLIIDDLLQAAPRHVAHRFRIRVDARSQTPPAVDETLGAGGIFD